MTRLLTGLFAGTMFGAGLAVSGMLDPVRVRGFLDIFGNWDPTLAFVMGGAILPMAVAWAIRNRMTAPLAAGSFDLPETRSITPALIGGSVLFGIGWGLAGLCPGPAIALLAIHPLQAAGFLAAMATGFALASLRERA